ncbi:MAG: hypothetical protein V2A76_08440 [Planctomycetota bacterium]
MRRLAGWFGLLALSGLALLTVSVNVKATQRCYNLGRALSAQEDLERIIRFRKERCRNLMNTRALAVVRAEMGLTDELLYPAAIGLPRPQPLALGAP